jgi:hypothetical protein
VGSVRFPHSNRIERLRVHLSFARIDARIHARLVALERGVDEVGLALAGQ